MDWHASPQLRGLQLRQPIAFIGGTADPILKWFGGADGVRAGLAKACTMPPQVHPIEDAGHWIQQEQPQQVSTLLLAFLDAHRQCFELDVECRMARSKL